jgi:hypothetical protein
VKVSVIVAAVLILAIAAVLLISDSDHGPGRHAPGGDPAEHVESDTPGDHAPVDGEHG